MKHILAIFIVISSFTAQGQVMLGIANSNFAGNMGMNLNPTSMLLMPYKWEVNLISGDIFVDNNYIRYPKARVMGSTEGSASNIPHGGFLDNYNSNLKNAHSHTHLRLPSFLYRTREQAFGVSFTVRSDVSVRNVAPNLAKYMYEGLEYTDLSGVPIQVDPFRIAGMTWAEIGLSYGRIIEKGNDQLLVAGTLNLIGAFQGLYFYNYKTADLTVTGDTVMTMSVNNLDAEVAFDLPRDQSEILEGRGKGASMNIGFTYVSNPYRGTFKDARTPVRKRYDYRFGVSIMDAGLVYFDRNAHVYTFKSSSTTLDSVNTISPAGVDGIDQLILDEFVNANSSIDNSFFLMPPLAVSAQLDVCLAPKWYANATIVQRANPPMPHVDFPNIVSVTPRYETSFFEIAMPYSLYDYYLMRIGLAMRYRFLVLGTDKLGPYVTNNDVTGMDFYFGIKFSDYDFMRKGKRGRSNHCDAYN
jgi:hypothetical protein